MNNYHIPVMLNEVLQYLDIKPGHWYVDCNLGGGGHTEGILKKSGKVLGIDLDPESIHEVARKYKLNVKNLNGHLFAKSENLILYQENFSNLKNIIDLICHSGKVQKPSLLDSGVVYAPQNDIKFSGVLFDLGVSTHQLDTPERGFSFNLEASLDMRMDPINQKVTASDLINGLHGKELADLFWKLGEERFSRQIARRIVEYRERKKIDSTNELANIILSVHRRSTKDRTHPATRIFQALRIAVNDELNALKEALPQALEVLQPSGRIVVISFHSLEDRIVKNFFSDHSIDSHPKLVSGSLRILTDKPIAPTVEEINQNPRSRSGKLRTVEKI